MINVIGVKFRTAGKVYYFDPIDLDVRYKDHVIVETVRGIEYGTVVIAPRGVTDDMVVQPLKPVIRIATPEDDRIYAQNCQKEKEAYSICQKKILEHGLEMKLVDTEYTFDNNKVLFYFTADGRIDFRSLVKDLAAIFRTRIELRQIGVRDETKLIGGISVCGRPLCCSTYLTDFVPVSIKMAKEQNLSLNPTKISGVCGRLMCCLKNEEEAYEYLNAKLPSLGATVTTPDGLRGEVQSTSVLKQRVKVIVTNEADEKEVREYPVDDLDFLHSKNYSANNNHTLDIDEEELKELELLEKEDTAEGLDIEAEEPSSRKKNFNNRNHSKNRNNHNSSGKRRYDNRNSSSSKNQGETSQKEKTSGQGKTEGHKSSNHGRYNNHHNSRGSRK